MVELMAPAGNFEMLVAALDAGADAVYFGIKGLNMRAGARNFDIEDMQKIASQCHEKGAKAYLALNTIIFDDELEKTREILVAAKDAGINAVICWDLGVVRMARDLHLDIHLSTQASTANVMAIQEYARLGVKRLVLARELSLEQIKDIISALHQDANGVEKPEIEVFIHGAMCVAVSGRCFMSQFLYGKSANRGECIQPCRRSYVVHDPETFEELEIDNHYVLSPKDLCTLGFIDMLIASNIDAFKIEGRGRMPEYVKIVVECYKEAIRLHSEKRLDKKEKDALISKLKTVYNRDFSNGFYLGKPASEWCDEYGSKSTMVKEYIGKIVNYYPKAMAAEVRLETGEICLGDKLLITGPTTGCIEAQAISLQIADQRVSSAKKGQSVGISLPSLVRKNDQVYLWKKRK